MSILEILIFGFVGGIVFLVILIDAIINLDPLMLVFGVGLLVMLFGLFKDNHAERLWS